jgi:hypothetical protein
MQLEVLGNLKSIHCLHGESIPDIPACSIVPQPTRPGISITLSRSLGIVLYSYALWLLLALQSVWIYCIVHSKLSERHVIKVVFYSFKSLEITRTFYMSRQKVSLYCEHKHKHSLVCVI